MPDYVGHGLYALLVFLVGLRTGYAMAQNHPPMPEEQRVRSRFTKPRTEEPTPNTTSKPGPIKMLSPEDRRRSPRENAVYKRQKELLDDL